MKMTSGMFSSLHLDWRTPQGVYKELDEEFHFDFDPCPPDPTFNGLEVEWGQRNFVNPPYGREIIHWCKKGYEEHLKGKLVVFLVAARKDNQWWHRYMMKAYEFRFIEGRLKFEGYGKKGCAPFPSVVVVFK